MSRWMLVDINNVSMVYIATKHSLHNIMVTEQNQLSAHKQGI